MESAWLPRGTEKETVETSCSNRYFCTRVLEEGVLPNQKTIGANMKYPDFTGALCREVGTEFFYPQDGNERDISLYSFGRMICSGCEVKAQCLEWGIQHEIYGMWGGTTPRERAVIRRKRNIQVNQPSLGEA